MRTCYSRSRARNNIPRLAYSYMPYILSAWTRIEPHRRGIVTTGARVTMNQKWEREEREGVGKRYARRSVSTGAPGVPAPRSERLPVSPDRPLLFPVLRVHDWKVRLCGVGEKPRRKDSECNVTYGDYNNYIVTIWERIQVFRERRQEMKKMELNLLLRNIYVEFFSRFPVHNTCVKCSKLKIDTTIKITIDAVCQYNSE